jgi:hypothetical protein
MIVTGPSFTSSTSTEHAGLNRHSPRESFSVLAPRHTERWVSSLPSLISHSRDWPEAPTNDIYHGPLGEIVQLIGPHSEADPIAIFTQLLVAFGNAVGRTAYVAVEADRHYPNLFTVLVGDTSKARKGTSWSHSRRVVAEADEPWAARVVRGLSSGEGLLAAVRERETSEGSEGTT